AIIEKAKLDGYSAISLSVDLRNTIALRLYEREEFQKIGILGTSWTMKLDFYTK
ncbi:MAG: family N-acetyltransferase, partial [Clostridiaceae bacterium]|nr:family N-acetyltransferase [Clostridiaceae bacterium]